MASERVDPARFELPVERIRDGFFTDAYFNLSKELLESAGRDPTVTMQVFQKKEALLGGIDEAIAVLELCAGRRAAGGKWLSGWAELEVEALAEGDRIEPWETVMHITGPYARFAHLETVYLGCLARRTRIAGNVEQVVAAANGKPVFSFGARHDHFANQPGDGWAVHLGGAAAVSTDAQGAWWGAEGIGTIPHALIAAYGGDTVAAARAFADHCGGRINVTVLVDFDNDSVPTALAVAAELGDELWGVRLDTSGSIVDRALWEEMGEFEPTGVNVALAKRVRAELDAAGHARVKIVASGGFDAEKIHEFERAGAPVDAYGVGSSLLRGSNDFTADVVKVEGRELAKAGRSFKPNERLRRVE